MLILGLSSFKNDTAAALLRDGVIEAAIENAKLQPAATRGIPDAAIEFCLSAANSKPNEKGSITFSDLDVIAVASKAAGGWRRRALSRPRLAPMAPIATTYQEGKELGRLAWEWTALRTLRQRAKSSSKVVTLDHHSCHAASAFFLSPFEKALILTLDGEGDGTSGMIAVGEGNKIRFRRSISFTDSIGWIYSRITDLLGFIPSKDEHKTQWLSLEGEPVFKDVFLHMLRRPGNVLPGVNFRYFHREVTGVFELSQFFFEQIGIPGGKPELTPELKRNVAASLQAAVAEVIGDLLASFLERTSQKKTGMEKICLGGGVFHNTLLVAALEHKFGVGNIFVPPAPGNAGCALGAAAWIWHQKMNKPREVSAEKEIRSVYWGPQYSRTEIKEVLDNAKARYSLQNTGERKLDSAVQLLRAGKIVGWFHGATEFGPRALGHRSLFASPWAPYVTENLNDFVKHRESFRPFAVSVRAEDCDKYFIGSPLCRLMNSLASVKPDADVLPRALQLPGGLVRLHVVEKEVDPVLWELLRRFGENEAAPILVNTSFNLPGEPPVIRPKDAVRTFFCSGIDAVFVDNFLLMKSSAVHILNVKPQANSDVHVTV